jgi:phosphoribosyl-AMP cyclohydrolase
MNTVSKTTAEQVLKAIQFNKDGLVPAIAQQFDTREVLMMAWMNQDAVRETLVNGRICYWSRSRGQLWHKGESSGQIQTLKEFCWDCDADTILLLVDQVGVACHTGRRNCFYNAVRGGDICIISDIKIDPEELYL